MSSILLVWRERLARAAPPHHPKRGRRVRPRWANDNRHILFTIEVGDVSGPYRDLQPHLYWVDVDDGEIEQWDKAFIGPVEHYAVTADNRSDLRAPRY